jgi:hypothetical protein
MADPLDLGQARMYIEEARGFIPEDGDPEAYIAAALQDAEAAIDELEAARAVIAALEYWGMLGHFFGSTPEEGSDVGKAMKAYLAMTASTGGGSR